MIPLAENNDINFLLQSDNIKKEQEALKSVQQMTLNLTRKVTEAENKLMSVGITKESRNQAIGKTEALLAKLDAAVDECELLGEQWNGLRRYNIYILIFIINDCPITDIYF